MVKGFHNMETQEHDVERNPCCFQPVSPDRHLENTTSSKQQQQQPTPPTSSPQQTAVNGVTTPHFQRPQLGSEPSASTEEPSFVTVQPSIEPVLINNSTVAANNPLCENDPSLTNPNWQLTNRTEQVQLTNQLNDSSHSSFGDNLRAQNIQPLEPNDTTTNCELNLPDDNLTLTNLDNVSYKQWPPSAYSSIPPPIPSYMEHHPNIHGGPPQYNPNPGGFPWQPPHFGQMPPPPPAHNGPPGMYAYPPLDVDPYQLQYMRPQYPGAPYYPAGMGYPQGPGAAPRMPVRFVRCGRPPLSHGYHHARAPYYGCRQMTRPPRYPPMMPPLIVGGRELKYNWPPPQEVHQGPRKRKRGAAAKTAAFHCGDAPSEELGSGAQDEGYQLPPIVNPVTESSYESQLPNAPAESYELPPYNNDTSSPSDAASLACIPQETLSAADADGPTAPDVARETPDADCSSLSVAAPRTCDLPYTPRASKITKATASGTYNMLQEAMQERPDKAVKLAKMHFSKRMLTLYGWLYPDNTKRDMKRAIDRLWDKLPPAEKEYYLSQAEGRFGTRATGVMINPQLAALPGLPEELLKNTTTSTTTTTTGANNTPLTETEDAVRHLIANDSWGHQEEGGETPPPKRLALSQQQEDESPPHRRPAAEVEVRRSSRKVKKRFTNLDFDSDEDGFDQLLQEEETPREEVSTAVSDNAEATHFEMDEINLFVYVDDGDVAQDDAVEESDMTDLRMLASVASERSPVYVTEAGDNKCFYGDEFAVGREEVVTNDDEIVGDGEGGMSGLEMLGVIAENEMEAMRQQMEDRNKHLWSYAADDDDYVYEEVVE